MIHAKNAGHSETIITMTIMESYSVIVTIANGLYYKYWKGEKMNEKIKI